MATKREQERDIAYKSIIGQLNDQSVYENVMRSCSRMIDLQHIDNVLAACSQKPYATALNTYDRWMSEANRHIEKGKSPYVSLEMNQIIQVHFFIRIRRYEGA